jgi:TPP-dependent pyruvate/acetoin dehydrogenase alpha subunit
MAGGSLISDTKFKQLYTDMLQCRLLTEHARGLGGRRRDLYSASLGQEAVVTGAAVDLKKFDAIVLAPHQPIAALVKGVALKNLIESLYAGGSSDFRRSDILPSAANTEGQLQLAAEAASGKSKGQAVMAFTGTLATSLDEFQPFFKAAVKKTLPLMVIVQNNPWGRANKAQPRPALRAPIEGLTSIVVDGNDVVGVYRVAYESLGRIRQGDGPVLIEARTYQQDGQVSSRAERDPLIHMERYLANKKLFTESWKNQLIQQFSRDLDAAVQALDLQTTRYLRASDTPAND